MASCRCRSRSSEPPLWTALKRSSLMETPMFCQRLAAELHHIDRSGRQPSGNQLSNRPDHARRGARSAVATTSRAAREGRTSARDHALRSMAANAR
jgi:hypothetical protein